MSQSISILGCGWLGLPLGKHLVEQGFIVCGSTTRAEKIDLIASAGMTAYRIEVGTELIGEGIPSFFESDLLVVDIPPGRRHADVEQRYPEQIETIVKAAQQYGTKHLLLISSTGVYGSFGQVVKETDSTAPDTASGRALVAAERYLMESKEGAHSVLRLAGLIGGERHPGRWFAGKKDLPGGNVPINLVHREDCIQAITAIVTQGKWGKYYHLCADEHPRKSVYYPIMTAQLGLEVPEFRENDEEPFKIISNEIIKRELGLQLRFPDPRVL